MGGLFISGANADRRDASFASPVDAIRGEVPLAARERRQANLFTRQLPSLDESVIFIQCPGREILVHRENKSGIGGLIVKEFFKFDCFLIIIWNKCFDLGPNLF